MKFLIISIIIISFLFNLFLSLLNYRNRLAQIPEEVKDVYDEEKYQTWLKYNMENFRLNLISSATSLFTMLILLIFNVFPMIYDFVVDSITDDKILRWLVFLGIYFLIEYFLDIIFSYYQSFSIEARYGFNKSTIKTFIIDKIKELILTIILGGLVIWGIASVYINNQENFFLYTLVGAIGIILFINLTYVRVFVPLFNKLKPLEDGELKEGIVNFAKSVGYEVNKIKVMNASLRSTKLNAFFSGFGKLKQVVLYDTLLDKMNTKQIEAVLAHEIGHAKKHHILKALLQSVINIAFMIFLLKLCVESKTLSEAFGYSAVNFGFGVIIFGLLLSPYNLLVSTITSPLSRKHEYEADHFAATHGYKTEMEEALKILSRENFDNLTPHPLFVAIKYSHPPIYARIRAIRNIQE